MNEPAAGPPTDVGSGLPSRTAIVTLVLVAVSGVAPAPAQERSAASYADSGEVVHRSLSLDEALAAAREGNADLRIAGARARAADAGARSAASFALPHLDLETGYTRSVDPVFAFGTKLRQERFTESDFSLDALNDPSALDDWSSTVTLQWGIASPGAWAEKDAAGDRASAAGWQERRTREATEFRTRALYFGAVAADAAVDAAVASEEAVRATVERFRRRRDEGLLTDAEVLQAEAELAAARADRTQAERDRHHARLDLGLHLGWSPDTLPVPTDTLTVPRLPEPVAAAPESRADLRARAAALDAAEAHDMAASLGWLPDVAAFAATSIHGRDPLGDDGTDWTVGVALRWSVFTGFQRPARNQAASAALESARIEYEQALRDARGEVRRALRTVEAARRAVEASRAARAAALSGRDLMRRRFEEGLATPSDLLQAEARAARMRSRAVEALAGYNIALARLDFVRARSDGEVHR